MAILSSPDKQLVLSDIYQWIVTNHLYFRSRGNGWKNSIRHNLSLNDCFIKSDRCPNGKGHYWTIHPANMDDFSKGDFRRRRAQQKVKRYTQHYSHSKDDYDESSSSEDELMSTTSTGTSFKDITKEVNVNDTRSDIGNDVKKKKSFDIETLLGIGKAI